MAKVFWNPNVVGGDGLGSTWENAYTNIVDAAAACAAGDTLVTAVNAGQTGLSGTTLAFSNSTETGPIKVISSVVGTGTAVVYQKSTTAQIVVDSTSAQDLSITGTNVVFHGVYLATADEFLLNAGSLIGHDSTLESGSTGTRTGTTSLGSQKKATLVNCTVKASDPQGGGAAISLSNGAQLLSINTRYESGDPTSTAGPLVRLLNDAYAKFIGGEFVDFAGTDFIELTGTPAKTLEMYGVKIPATITTLVENESTLNAASDIQIYATDSTLSDRFYAADGIGKFVEETAIYLNNNLSIEATTFSQAESWYNPSRMKLPELNADFSTAKTIDVEIAQDGTTTGLTDQEIWIEVHYPDDLTTTLLVDDNKAAQPESGAITHTSSTASWSNLSGTNSRQKLSVTTSQTGREGVGIVYLCFAKPSSTVFIDPQITVT